MHCEFCGRPLAVNSAWKGASHKFYCGEFCAESEAPEAAVRKQVPSTLLQHHLHRPYERLERLLPYMRRSSRQAA